MRRLTLAALALALAACKADPPADPAAAPPADPTVPSGAAATPGTPTAPDAPGTPTAADPLAAVPAPTPPGADDPRAPADFAAAWHTVRTAPPDERGLRGKALADGWRGRRYTWTAYALAGLCADATRTCGLNPFERNTTPALDSVRGHSPLVTFTPAAYDRLRRDCAGRPGCVVTVRARLADIVSDPAEPLALTFADAEITEARDPRPDERWFGPAPDAPVPARREGAKLPVGEPLTNVPTLAPRVFQPPAP